MRLKKYLPEFVSQLKEFQEIDTTLSQELNLINDHLIFIQTNQFIETADHEGLSRYEKMFHIQQEEELEIRRFNILSQYNSSIPFTMRWLENLLNTTVGKSFYLIHLEPTKYILTISIVEAKSFVMPTLQKELRKKIPANLILNINLLSPIDMSTHIGAYIRTYDQYNI